VKNYSVLLNNSMESSSFLRSHQLYSYSRISKYFMEPESSLVLTRTHYWFKFWARWIQSIPPHSISLRSILILSSHLHLYLPSGFFTSGLPIKILYAFLSSSVFATCLTHLVLLGLIVLLCFNTPSFKMAWPGSEVYVIARDLPMPYSSRCRFPFSSQKPTF
jgi:hypothetical protein